MSKRTVAGRRVPGRRHDRDAAPGWDAALQGERPRPRQSEPRPRQSEPAPRSKPPERIRMTSRGAVEVPFEDHGTDLGDTEHRGWMRHDQVLAGVALVLLVIGLVMVFSVSSATGLFRPDGDPFYYARQQTLVACAGLVIMLIVSRLDYRRFRVLSVVGVVVTSALLLAVHVPGVGLEAGGASRWINLGPLSVQPSELAKLAVILAAAHLLATRRARSGAFEDLMWPLGLIVAVVCGLILIQRDLGTALVVGVTIMGMLWIAGMRGRDWLGLSAAGVTLTLVAIFSEDYRRERFLAFLQPLADPQDSGFQVLQSFIALGSGGWFGVGPGLSVQKFSYLPEAHTDMILAVLGEEWGLVGVIVVAMLFVAFAVCGVLLALRCRDPFGRLLAAGCTFLVVGQAAINMGGVMGALPLTGVPLPFISYGRMNLLVVLVAVGLMLSVARFGPIVVASGAHPQPLETADVTHIDSRRRYGGSRRSGSRDR